MNKMSRIRGALYGFAIGDAMGATTEFMTEEEIRRKFGKVNSIMGRGWLNLEKGEVTDDTQMMLCVAHAMMDTYEAHSRQLTLGYICHNFIEWYKTNPKDIGNACRAVIEEAYSLYPVDWYSKSTRLQRTSGPFLGNGGLMRCLVPCLAGDRLLATNQSSLTHNNSTCSQVIESYADYIESALQGKKLQRFNPVSLMSPEGHVTNTYENVVYWFSTTDNFKDAILGPVNHGGDADTIAALTGGLAGAYYGLGAIPTEWIEDLDYSVKDELNRISLFLNDL